MHRDTKFKPVPIQGRFWKYVRKTSQEKLGKEYGVNQTLIGFIVRGATWKHLPL